MSFFVYENWTQKKAVIHRATCPSCNYGKGIHKHDSGKHGRWLGGFESFQEAAVAAHNTGQVHWLCRRCNPYDAS